MKNVTIRMSEEAIETAEKLYGAKVTGAQNAVEAYFELQKRTMQELKNRFLKSEIHAIVDNLNGTMQQPQFQSSSEMLWWHLEDGNSFEGLFDRWEIKYVETFKSKILQLTSAQTFFLQDAISRFWSTNGNLEEFVLSLNPVD